MTDITYQGISGIKVPRNAGTCTRCPLEINLTESAVATDVWKCKISLYKKYVYEGLQGSNVAIRPSARHATARVEIATKARPLGPWTLQDGEDFHFFTTTSKEDVPHALYLAQLATLNPSASHENYKPGNDDPGSKHQVKFSPNVVRLDISGPQLPNLSFYDLPGVINQSEVAEEEYLVNLVRNLVKEYIKADNCINLLAIPMTDDPANSSASKLIREVKAEARTVGVLTKPDRYQKGESLDQWIQVLTGKKFRLGFGYYVVKNNPDPRVDNATARAEESLFFSEEEPWARTLGKYDGRFGTFKLQTDLSHRLTAQIKASLPRITEQILQKAAYVDQKLKMLPQPPAGNLPMQVLEKILKLEDGLKKHINGGSAEFPFQKDWKHLVVEFRKIMAESRPKLVLSSPPQYRAASQATDESPGTPTPAGRNPPITIDSDDDELPSKPTSISHRSGSKRVRTDSVQFTPQKSQRMSDIPSFTANKEKETFAKRFYLPEIRGYINDATIGLPGQIDPKATDRMIKISMQLWEKPLDRFLECTGDLCRAMILERVTEIFGDWVQTLFYTQMLSLCDLFIEEALLQQRQLAQRILNWELTRPMTFDEEGMRSATDKALFEIQRKQLSARANVWLEKQERNGKVSTGPGRIEKLSKVTEAQIGPDPYAQEVIAMGTVRGYYECAFSEFVNVICKGINSELFMKCRDELGSKMKHHFRLMEPDANERFTMLLEVDAENQEKRLQLKKEKETLQKAQDWLEGLTGDAVSHSRSTV